MSDETTREAARLQLAHNLGEEPFSNCERILKDRNWDWTGFSDHCSVYQPVNTNTDVAIYLFDLFAEGGRGPDDSHWLVVNEKTSDIMAGGFHPQQLINWLEKNIF